MAKVNNKTTKPPKESSTNKKTETKATTKSLKNTSSTPGSEEKEPIIKHIIAILLFFISIILFIACISYFFTWQEDQSITFISFVKGESLNEAVNVCGRMGAMASRTFISDWFGVFGIILPFIFTTIAAYIFALKKNFLFKSLTIILATAIIGSIASCYFFPEYNGIFGSTLGGTAGYAAHALLYDLVGEVGELVTIIMLSAILIVYISRKVIPAIFKFFVTIEGIFKYLYDKYGVQRPKKRPVRQREVINRENSEFVFNDLEETAPIVSLNELYSTENLNDNYSSPINAPFETDYTQNNETIEFNEYEEPLESDEYEETPTPIEEDDIEEDDIQEKYSEQIDEFNRTIGVVETEDSFKIEPTIISRSESTFEASEIIEATPKATNNPQDLLYSNDDMVVLDPAIFGELPTEDAVVAVEESSDFEVYTVEEETEAVKSEGTEGSKDLNEKIFLANEIVAEPKPIKETIVEPVTTKTEAVKEEIVKETKEDDDFTIERTTTNDDDDKFEVSVTDNATLEIEDDELSLVKINKSEYFNDEDIDTSVFDPTLSLSRYKVPTIDLMDNHTTKVNVTNEELFENKNKIIETLNNFNIQIDKIKATIGPTVTLYEIVPAPGVRISKIKNLEDDIALSLSALGIRIIAPIPGKGTIGIEVPNKDKEVVSMYSVIKGVKFQESKAELPIVLGRTIQNEDYVIDLAKTPHMLVAGATGQGKSVGLNAIITSLLYKKHPAELKFVFVDPKKVELTLYSLLERHFLAKLPDEEEAIITDTQKVVYTLNSMCCLMDDRYDTLKKAKVRNIKEYNDKFMARKLNPNNGHDFMPYFVVVIDEFADLIMTAGREVETPIARLAQLGRATGIHLVIATQRPTTNIITGVIKANFPTRVAFRVSSMIDSRTILDQPGANQLIGRGDMLISNGNDTTRVQCAFIDTPEVERICEYIHEQTGYGEAYELPEYVEPTKEKDGDRSGNLVTKDGLFNEVARYVVTSQQGSASTIQRNFSIGFNRAGRIMDQLEKAGIVGKQEGSKPRKVLISDISSLEVLLYDMENSMPNY